MIGVAGEKKLEREVKKLRAIVGSWLGKEKKGPQMASLEEVT